MNEARARGREALWAWGIGFVALMVARYAVAPFVPFVAQNLKALAVLAFLYLPNHLMAQRGERFSDYGLSLAEWRRGLAWGLGVVALLLPVVGVAMWGLLEASRILPPAWGAVLGPFRGSYDFALRLPEGFAWAALTQGLVVALPEEFFYRGFLYQRLAAWFGDEARGRALWGGRLGPAFWWQAGLFAVGHLTEPYPWRLTVFFPALLFLWLRQRSGGLVAPIVAHAGSNLMVIFLEACFFGRP